MIPPGTQPAEILRLLGITDPEDIDIEAIAYACGATILKEPLTGCEANIIGRDDRAIITINNRSTRGRQRFSAGHELGHWMKDRGQSAFGCSKNQLYASWTGTNAETRANRFASDILLPLAMFRPRTRGLPATFESVESIAEIFQTSITATALKFVEHGWLPSMLICNSRKGRDWFVASDGVKGKLWPKDSPGTGSIAHALLTGKNTGQRQGEVGTDEWINHPAARRYWIHEDSIVVGRGTAVLSLLWWKDEAFLIRIDEEEERRSSSRSDYRL